MDIEKRLVQIEADINSLWNHYESLTHTIDTIESEYHCDSLKIILPHKFTICNGRIFIEQSEVCPPCEGSGIVWS